MKGALGLFDSQNKALGGSDQDSVIPADEYESTMPDKKIMELVSQWKRLFEPYYAQIEPTQKKSFDYWVGKQEPEKLTSKDGHQAVDNVLFQAIETFLPIATKSNPEPLVQADPSDAGQSLAKDIKVALVHESDVQQLRRKLAKMTRGWLLNRLGVMKVSWNPITQSIETAVINSKRMILDPTGFIDERGIFQGEFEGEKKRTSASDLMEMFPKKREDILERAQRKEGTMLNWIEWWYRGTDVFCTIDDTLLGKFKNHNWNYDIEETEADEETGTPATPFVAGVNHMKEFTSPYRYLSIFSVGEQPHDSTSLILQNIPVQDSINETSGQIAFNVKRMNNGLVVSGDFYTEDQAAQVSSAWAKGTTIRQPSGDPSKGTVMFPHSPLPGDVFQKLEDDRSQLQGIFGTSGSTPQGVAGQDTVRGKIMVNQMDSSRIGGGITDAIEQVADSIYNLWVQFMVVYYDAPHFISASGMASGTELVQMVNTRFYGIETLDITVKEGSLVPKDPLTQRNQAVELWSQNAIDPLSFYKALDLPDPEEATSQLILWQMLQKGQIQPQQYLPSFQIPPPQAPQALPGQQPGTGGPAVSPPPNAGTVNPSVPPPTNESADIQSKQLLQSQPIK